MTNEWIPVSKRKPNNERNILVHTDNGNIYMGYYYRKKFHVQDFGLVTLDMPITHWMNVPKPPRL